MRDTLFGGIFTFVMLAAVVAFGSPPLRRFVLTGLGVIALTVVVIGGIVAAMSVAA